MYYFLILLIAGFGANLASSCTKIYSEKWGKKTGTFITVILRDVLGIPVWAIGFVLAIKESGGLVYQSSGMNQVAGWFIMAVGASVIIIALIQIRVKAAAPSVGDSLVRTGIYSVIRHPIHSGTLLEFIGLFILWPSLNVGIASMIGLLWIVLQTRLEEKDLVRRIPDYKGYMEEVPRFIPRLRKKRHGTNLHSG
jgi:protein-S-isoprenylcysteine O-methyltransferase Ste14